MHSVRVHKVIALIIYFFYLIGVWHRGDKPTTRELRIKWFYSLYYPLVILSLTIGAITNEKKGESVFLTEISIGCAVLVLRLWLLIWKQNEILDLLNRICVFSIRYDDDYNNFNDKLRGFPKLMVTFAITITLICTSTTMVVPLLENDKVLFLEIGFPFDWRNNEIAFWIAVIFLFTESLFSITATIFTTIIWYLLFICSLRYKVLGSELKKMGQKITELQMCRDFFDDLKASIDAHLHLRELTDELGSYFSNVFFIQFGTSSLCICGSIYCLAFDIKDDLSGRVLFLLIFFYFMADTFMITYFGNEIFLSSNRLSYCLFESDWIEQPQSTKRCVILFSEYLKRPQILNSAYSMFNILKSFQP